MAYARHQGTQISRAPNPTLHRALSSWSNLHMQRASLFTLAAAAALCACTGTSKEGKPPARLDGTWFGSWTGADEFGQPIGSGFYFVLDHDEDGGTVSGTAFSSIAGAGTVTGQVGGSKFTLNVAYPGGGSETYEGREIFGTVDNGNYDGTLSATPLDGEFGMFPAELAHTGFAAAPGQVSGHVTTGGGTMSVAGATVSIGAGDARLETVTNAAGDYSFSAVAGGPRVIVITAAGGESAYFPVVVNGQVNVADINLVPAVDPPGRPVIELAAAIDGITVANSVVFAQGQLTQNDAPFLVASINGGEFLVPVDAGAFHYALILSRGVNTVILQAINQNGVTEQTLLANANVQPQKIRVTMVWDEGRADGTSGGNINDQDLHVWQFAPGGGAAQHAYFNEPSAIANGILDLDNTFGFGPENFTMPTAAAGDYYVAVNFFEGVDATRDIVRVSLNENTPNETVYLFGPQLMTLGNMDGGYPVTVTTASWWRVADIVVDASGLATLAAAPNPDTAFALPD